MRDFLILKRVATYINPMTFIDVNDFFAFKSILAFFGGHFFKFFKYFWICL